jgi:acetyltransferase
LVNAYPKKYETSWKLRDGRTITLRPIKPEDAPLWVEMFQKFSEESKRYRFFQNIKDTPPEVIARYCNINYDKEMAIVAELTEENQRRILGVVRLVVEPDAKTGEIAFIVADPWQGLGLGWKMVEYMIEICKDKELEAIYALILRHNDRSIKLVKEMGFSIESFDQETVKATLSLRDQPKHRQKQIEPAQ